MVIAKREETYFSKLGGCRGKEGESQVTHTASKNKLGKYVGGLFLSALGSAPQPPPASYSPAAVAEGEQQAGREGKGREAAWWGGGSSSSSSTRRGFSSRMENEEESRGRENERRSGGQRRSDPRKGQAGETAGGGGGAVHFAGLVHSTLERCRKLSGLAH